MIHNTLAKRFTRLGLAACLVFVSGCTGSTNGDRNRDSDELGRANHLIDRGQYSEAIYILDNRLRHNPDELRTRVLLASAYANRAGLSLSRYQKFAVEMDRWDEGDEGVDNRGVDPLITKLAEYAWHLHVVLRALAALPQPQTENQRADLNSALGVLDDVPGEISGGPAYFRGLIRASLFKDNLVNKYRFKHIEGCRVPKMEILEWLVVVGEDLSLILTDMAYGSKDDGSRANLLKNAADVRHWVREGEALPARARDRSREALETLALPNGIKEVYGPCD